MKYGYVRCNCFVEGKTPRPPNDRFISVSEKSIEWNPDGHDAEGAELSQQEAAFADWRLHACRHPDMHAANTLVGTEDRINDFKASLAFLENAPDAFPVIAQYLPSSECSRLDGKFAAQLLDESERLERCTIALKMFRLVNRTANEIVASVSARTPCLILNGQDVREHLCLGDAQFFVSRHFLKTDSRLQQVIESKTKKVFAATRFCQEVIAQGRFRFTEIGTGKAWESCSGLVRPRHSGEAQEFEVIGVHSQFNDEYRDILVALKQLAIASIETGNAVFWSLDG